MNWKVGDRAMLIHCAHIKNEGTACEIISSADGWEHYDGVVRWKVVNFSGTWDAAAGNLIPIPDDKFERFHADLISCDDDWTIPWSVTV